MDISVIGSSCIPWVGDIMPPGHVLATAHSVPAVIYSARHWTPTGRPASSSPLRAAEMIRSTPACRMPVRSCAQLLDGV